MSAEHDIVEDYNAKELGIWIDNLSTGVDMLNSALDLRMNGPAMYEIAREVASRAEMIQGACGQARNKYRTRNS